MQESFNRLLEQYEFLSAQIDKQTQLLRHLSETAMYRERVRVLQSIPEVGLSSAMELLLELQDVSRFRRAEQLAAYVGLTPSDLPPLVVPSFKLGWGSSHARDPGGAQRSQDLWASPVWPRVLVADNPRYCEAVPYCNFSASALSGSGPPSGCRKSPR
jgi:Transposase IS116/IS110/IS902 family